MGTYLNTIILGVRLTLLEMLLTLGIIKWTKPLIGCLTTLFIENLVKMLAKELITSLVAQINFILYKQEITLLFEFI